jgi:hypothetical protein
MYLPSDTVSKFLQVVLHGKILCLLLDSGKYNDLVDVVIIVLLDN